MIDESSQNLLLEDAKRQFEALLESFEELLSSQDSPGDPIPADFPRYWNTVRLALLKITISEALASLKAGVAEDWATPAEVEAWFNGVAFVIRTMILTEVESAEYPLK